MVENSSVNDISSIDENAVALNKTKIEEWHCLKKGFTCSHECYLKIIFDLFGKKHTLEIMRELLQHPRLRFNELCTYIESSPKTLTKRLRELEHFSLIERRSYKEIPPRVEYSLTPAGKELDILFENISQWISKWNSTIFKR